MKLNKFPTKGIFLKQKFANQRIKDNHFDTYPKMLNSVLLTSKMFLNPGLKF